MFLEGSPTLITFNIGVNSRFDFFCVRAKTIAAHSLLLLISSI
ncbi:hypothetical protein CVCC1112_1507 [Paenarthrobacter nicotinovorans]|nr:hypothetical protein CVCC1112_1507 [Paenarthrobacter nicotinovorans]